MSSEKSAFYQRVLYTGLRRMTNDRNTIQQAFSHWQKNMDPQRFDVVEVILRDGERPKVGVVRDAF